MEMESLITLLKEYSIQYGMRLLGGLIVLVVGLRIVSFLTRRFKAFISKSNVDNSLKPFLQNLVVISLRLMVFIVVLGTMGVEMTSFAALLASAGVAVGLALSGTLQNFAGGVVLLVLKPFKVGDFIEMGQNKGVVTGIQVFYTYLKTADNRVIIIPNGAVSSGALINYTSMPTRRVDIPLGISYNDNIDKVRGIVMGLAENHELVLKDPAPVMFVTAHADSAIEISFRVWTNTPDYWTVYFFMMEEIKKTFDREGISIPFPQHDVHLIGKV